MEALRCNVFVRNVVFDTVTMVTFYFISGINVAGVKWVIRLQLLLLFVLFLSMMDFLVGSFVHTDVGKD